MNAELIFRQKEARDRYIREMVVWRLFEPVPGCRHLFKYRFYFGTDAGVCLVRYDNERGKGDHRHLLGTEHQYVFGGLKQLLSDFDYDIRQAMEDR
jgi:Family of unknown function (DUF6516)